MWQDSGAGPVEGVTRLTRKKEARGTAKGIEKRRGGSPPQRERSESLSQKIDERRNSIFSGAPWSKEDGEGRRWASALAGETRCHKSEENFQFQYRELLHRTLQPLDPRLVWDIISGNLIQRNEIFFGVDFSFVSDMLVFGNFVGRNGIFFVADFSFGKFTFGNWMFFTADF